MSHFKEHNDKEETAKHLSFDSKLNSTQNTAEWWKNLEPSDNEHNISSSRRNTSAGIAQSVVRVTL